MADQTALASVLQNVPHLAAIEKISEIRFQSLDISKLYVYLVDTVDASALPALAEQFDVLGIKGFGLATTEAEKRAIVKRAIELHRFKGTPYAIKQSLLALGFASVQVVEHVGNYYDGSFDYDGSHDHGAGSWANFKVIIDIGDKVVGQAEIDLINAIIEEYKNVRSKLVDLDIVQAGVPIDILDVFFSGVDLTILSVEPVLNMTNIARGLVGAGDEYTAIADFATAHGLSVGDYCFVRDCAQAGYNGLHLVKSVTSSTRLKFQLSDNSLTPETNSGNLQKQSNSILMNATVNLKVYSDYGVKLYIRNQVCRSGDYSITQYSTYKSSVSGKTYRVVIASGGENAQDSTSGYGIDAMTIVDGFDPATTETLQLFATAALTLDRYNQIDDTI